MVTEALFGSYLTKSEVEAFQKISKDVYHRELTYAEAEDQGTRLTMLFEAMQKGSSHVPLPGIDIVDSKKKEGKNEND